MTLYVVEKVLAQQVNEEGETVVRVKWKGYGPEDNTWEPWANVNQTKAYWEWQEKHEGVVEKILDKRSIDGNLKCLVKWQNQVETEWIPFQNNLENTVAYDEYLRRIKKKPTSRKRKKPLEEKPPNKRRKENVIGSSSESEDGKEGSSSSAICSDHSDSSDDEVIKIPKLRGKPQVKLKETVRGVKSEPIRKLSSAEPKRKRITLKLPIRKKPAFQKWDPHPLARFPRPPGPDEVILDVFSSSSEEEDFYDDAFSDL